MPGVKKRPSRLERLCSLLTGGSSATRRAAAKEFGAIQRSQPDQLPHLLARLHVHLRSKTWDTRVAAGQAIGCLCKEVADTVSADAATRAEERAEGSPARADAPVLKLAEESIPEPGLTFEIFDVHKVLLSCFAL